MAYVCGKCFAPIYGIMMRRKRGSGTEEAEKQRSRSIAGEGEAEDETDATKHRIILDTSR
eukprot:6088326-Heterocapsa_arctica.AAC.1